LNRHLAAILTPPLLPILLAQAVWLRKTTPRLPDAAGPSEGSITGAGEPLQVIVLGESTVAGIGARTHETGLAGQFAAAIHRANGRPVEWRVLARSGINARKARLELLPQLAGRRADVVVIALGVNDTIELHTARRWVADIQALIVDLRAQLGEATIVLSGVPPLDYFPALPEPLSFVLGARSAALERAVIRLSSTMNRVIHVPFQIDRRRVDEMFCADGFHPSEAGYTAWAEQLVAAFVDYANPGTLKARRADS
jgi:lysophospholipase L1-like esterase